MGRHFFYQLMISCVCTIAVAALICEVADPVLAQAPAKPDELTLNGIIANEAMEKYNEIIDSCDRRGRGIPSSGPRYVSCLNENIQSEKRAIEDYLRSWKWPSRPQFQRNNCETIRSISPRAIKEENYLDCVLKGTIEFRLALKSLIGD